MSTSVPTAAMPILRIWFSPQSTTEREWRVSEPDGNAFWSVKELVVPAYKEGKPVTELAEGSFNNDYSLQAVRLPYTLKKLNGNFISCNSLISLNVPDSVDYMGGSFAGSKNTRRYEVQHRRRRSGSVGRLGVRDQRLG